MAQLEIRPNPETECLGEESEPIDPQLGPVLVEEDVAGFAEGPVEIDPAVTAALPAAVATPSETVVARTEHLAASVDDTIFEQGRSHQRLVGGTRRIMGLQHPVL